jgi:hypothetical protein
VAAVGAERVGELSGARIEALMRPFPWHFQSNFSLVFGKEDRANSMIFLHD